MKRFFYSGIVTVFLLGILLGLPMQIHAATTQEQSMETLHNYICSFGGKGSGDYYIVTFNTTFENNTKYEWKANYSKSKNECKLFCMMYYYGQNKWHVLPDEIFSILFNENDISFAQLKYENGEKEYTAISVLSNDSFDCNQIPNVDWTCIKEPNDNSINVSFVSNLKLNFVYTGFDTVLNDKCELTMHLLGFGKHILNKIVTTPTCTEQGFTTYSCNYCDTIFKNDYTNPLGHMFESNEQYCLNGCGAVNPDYVPPHVHAYNAVVTAPKATALGYTQYKCACGVWKKDAAGKVVKDIFTAPTGKLTLKCKARTANAETLLWNKLGGISGYQIQVSNAKGSAWATAKVSAANAYTFKGLAAGSAYKFRVRFYIKAADGKNYFSSWSKTLSSPTLPAGTVFTKLTPAKRAFVAQWKKNATVTGYQIQYGLKSNFNGAKTLTVKNAKTIKAIMKSLSAKKIYYVRIRTYKTISKVNYYSAWSKTYKVKTK